MTEVEDGGTAAERGIEPGDIIRKIGPSQARAVSDAASNAGSIGVSSADGRRVSGSEFVDSTVAPSNSASCGFAAAACRSLDPPPNMAEIRDRSHLIPRVIIKDRWY